VGWWEEVRCDERIELLLQTLEELKELSNDGIPIVVEGMRDVRTLRALGIEGQIIHLGHGSVINFAEELGRRYNEIIILTDWDKRGDELSQRIAKSFRALGGKPNTRIRGRFKKLAMRDTKDVEGLYGLFLKISH
jgi:2,5-diamino-6-(ribosylamino)-4(3H)-pyrimidinone 5'-phosphate reductase